MARNSATSLAPGFRFHPTDEELVRYYLNRKILNKPFYDLISVIDIYKYEPWDLPDKSKLESRDLEWYFFSALDKKYGNGSKTNRATDRGYWKTTGKDRAIRFKERVFGMKKTLVYHKGRPPRGERSNWVMHKYRLTDEALGKDIQKDAFVLCRVFQKSGSGPKNGEQYGAPFIEEEWGDDVAVTVPGQHDVAVYEEAANDVFVEVNDINQNFDIGNPSENNIILPSNIYYGELSHCLEHSMEFKEDYQQPTCMHITEGDSKSQHKVELSDLPEPNATVDNVKPSNDEYVFELIEDINYENYVLEAPYQDVTDDLPINDDELFPEANDFSNHIDPNSEYFDIGEYLSFDAADDQLLAFDYDQTVGSDTPVSGQEPLTQTQTNEGIGQEPNASENGNSEASSSKQELEHTKVELGTKYSFIKQASQMLGSFPAPPAFASEFPSKDAILKLNSALQASSSGHVMSGMARKSNTTSSGNQLDWSYNNNGSVDIVLSFNLPEGDINTSRFLQMASLLSGKTGLLFQEVGSSRCYFWS